MTPLWTLHTSLLHTISTTLNKRQLECYPADRRSTPSHQIAVSKGKCVHPGTVIPACYLACYLFNHSVKSRGDNTTQFAPSSMPAPLLCPAHRTTVQPHCQPPPKPPPTPPMSRPPLPRPCPLPNSPRGPPGGPKPAPRPPSPPSSPNRGPAQQAAHTSCM